VHRLQHAARESALTASICKANDFRRRSEQTVQRAARACGNLAGRDVCSVAGRAVHLQRDRLTLIAKGARAVDQLSFVLCSNSDFNTAADRHRGTAISVPAFCRDGSDGLSRRPRERAIVHGGAWLDRRRGGKTRILLECPFRLSPENQIAQEVRAPQESATRGGAGRAARRHG